MWCVSVCIFTSQAKQSETNELKHNSLTWFTLQTIGDYYHQEFQAPQRFAAQRLSSSTVSSTVSDNISEPYLQSPTTSAAADAHFHLNQNNIPPPQPSPPRSVSILVYKTLNSVLKSGRKVIFRVCEVATVRKVRSYKMFNLYSSMKGRNEEEKPRELETTGHDRFCQSRPSRWVSGHTHVNGGKLTFNSPIWIFLSSPKLTYNLLQRIPLESSKIYDCLNTNHLSIRNQYRKKRKKPVQRAQSAAEFDPRVLTAANKRNLFK